MHQVRCVQALAGSRPCILRSLNQTMSSVKYCLSLGPQKMGLMAVCFSVLCVGKQRCSIGSCVSLRNDIKCSWNSGLVARELCPVDVGVPKSLLFKDVLSFRDRLAGVCLHGFLWKHQNFWSGGIKLVW